MKVLIDTNPCERCELAPCLCGAEIEQCMRSGPYTEEQSAKYLEAERQEMLYICKEATHEHDT